MDKVFGAGKPPSRQTTNDLRPRLDRPIRLPPSRVMQNRTDASTSAAKERDWIRQRSLEIEREARQKEEATKTRLLQQKDETGSGSTPKTSSSLAVLAKLGVSPTAQVFGDPQAKLLQDPDIEGTSAEQQQQQQLEEEDHGPAELSRNDFIRKVGLGVPSRTKKLTSASTPFSPSRALVVASTPKPSGDASSPSAMQRSKSKDPAAATGWRRFLPNDAPLLPPPPLFDTRIPTEADAVNTEQLVHQFKLLHLDEGEHAAYLQQQEHLNGNEIAFQMKQSLLRVDRILRSLGTDRRFRDVASYSSEVTSHSSAAAAHARHGDSAESELRAIIQILLADLQKQTTTTKELEAADTARAAELRNLRAEHGKMSNTIAGLRQQCDGLLAENETLKKQLARAASSPALPGRRDSVAGRRASLVTFPSPHGAASEGANQLQQQQQQPDTESHDVEESPGVEEVLLQSGVFNEAPRGDVTVVCTGVQAADKLWEALPQEMVLARALHDRILKEQIAKFKGYEVRSSGDSALVVFQDTVDAVLFACAVHEAMVGQMWPKALEEVAECATVEKTSNNENDDSSNNNSTPGCGFLWRGLRLRMGVHCGEAHVEMNAETGDAEYMGVTVNRAVQLRRISFGGMTACSKEVYDRVVAAAGDAASLSFAESTRRQSLSSSSSQLMQRQTTRATQLCNVSATFHCRIPSAKVFASDVYCVLPLTLEERLATIRQEMGKVAATRGIDAKDQFQQRVADVEGPSELEAMLGTFSRHRDETTLFVTGDGVEDAAQQTDDERAAVAVAQSGLPSGEVTLLALRSPTLSNQRFVQRALEREVQSLVTFMQSCVDLSIGKYGGRLVSRVGDKHLVAFSNVASAVMCALALDVELTTSEWPAVVSGHIETEEVRWRSNRVFNGLRVAIGVHGGFMEPRFDPLTNTVGYSGHEAFTAVRLSSMAGPGQTFLLERTAYGVLPQMFVIDPRPYFSNVSTMSVRFNEAASESLHICEVMSRSFVGRAFLAAGVKVHDARTKRSHLYKQLRAAVMQEDVRWTRNATLVFAKSGGVMQQKGHEDDVMRREKQQSDNDGSDNNMDSTLPLMNRTRTRDIDHSTIIASTLAERLRGVSSDIAVLSKEPTVAQLEIVEHNLMLMRDPFYDGQLAPYKPMFLDVVDVRQLPLGLMAPPGLSNSAPTSPILSRQGSAHRRGNSSFASASDNGDDKSSNGGGGGSDAEGSEIDDDDSDPGGARRRRSTIRVRRAVFDAAFGEEVSDTATENTAVTSNAFGNATEQLAATQAELRRACREVLAEHKIARKVFALLKSWMEPVLDPTKYTMSDDEVVSKIVQACRIAHSEVFKTIDQAADMTVHGEWRRLTDATVDETREDASIGNAQQLCRSLTSQMCKHFLFLRQYMKRMRHAKIAQRDERMYS